MTADTRTPTANAAFAAESAPRKAWDVARVASGNFLEMYDFMVFGYFAGPIGDAFFPHGDAFARLLAALATFGVGFLMRPVGAVVLGAFTDRHGRRAGLLLTLLLMGVGILTLTLTPSVSWWSTHAPALAWLAPVLVLAGRLVQGFSAGRSSATSRSTCRRSRRRGDGASTSPGSRPPSRWRWSRPRRWASRWPPCCRRTRCTPGAGACRWAWGA